MAASTAQHYLTLRPCIELLTLGENGGGQTLLIPRGEFSASNLTILRLADDLQLTRNQSRTSSFLLLLTSGGLIVYLLYKSFNEENSSHHLSTGSFNFRVTLQMIR